MLHGREPSRKGDAISGQDCCVHCESVSGCVARKLGNHRKWLRTRVSGARPLAVDRALTWRRYLTEANELNTELAGTGSSEG